MAKSITRDHGKVVTTKVMQHANWIKTMILAILLKVGSVSNNFFIWGHFSFKINCLINYLFTSSKYLFNNSRSISFLLDAWRSSVVSHWNYVQDIWAPIEGGSHLKVDLDLQVTAIIIAVTLARSFPFHYRLMVHDRYDDLAKAQWKRERKIRTILMLINVYALLGRVRSAHLCRISQCATNRNERACGLALAILSASSAHYHILYDNKTNEGKQNQHKSRRPIWASATLPVLKNYLRWSASTFTNERVRWNNIWCKLYISWENMGCPQVLVRAQTRSAEN